MTIKQLSVFLENKTGRINDVAKTLAKYDINMHASAWLNLQILESFV